MSIYEQHDMTLPKSYYSPRNPRPAGAPVFFVDSAEAAANGFRFVAYADDLGAAKHKGWFVDEFQDETYRGAVFQLATGPRGEMRFAAGYAESCSGGYVVDVRGRGAVVAETIAAPDHRYYHDRTSAARDAAFSADENARIAAEHEREYREAWQAGAHYAELGEEIVDTRRAILAALAERRNVPAAETPTLCAMLRRKVSDMLKDIAKAREERAELAWNLTRRDSFGDAFRDGAGV